MRKPIAKRKMFKKEFSSVIGPVTIVATDQGVQAVWFGGHDSLASSFQDAKESPEHPVLAQCERELQEYFAGTRKEFSVPLAPSGTEFQKKVWRALRQIPFGKTESYSQQAKRMGKPKGVRAVAAANGRNPIAIIVPCHRVIAATGHLHGYAGGLDMKRRLLELEGIKIENLRVGGA